MLTRYRLEAKIKPREGMSGVNSSYIVALQRFKVNMF